MSRLLIRPATTEVVLLEDNTNLLLEDGTNVLME